MKNFGTLDELEVGRVPRKVHFESKCLGVFLTNNASSSSCQVLAHFDGNLVVVPIVYNFEAQRAHIKQAYGQVKTLNVLPPAANRLVFKKRVER